MSAAPLPTKMLTRAQVMERLSISQSTLDRLARERTIPSYRIGTAVRYAEEDIAAYLESVRMAPREPSATEPEQRRSRPRPAPFSTIPNAHRGTR